MMHKFYCVRCSQFIFSDSLITLSSRVNNHMVLKHPMTFANWNPTTIVQSNNYESADEAPAYLAKREDHKAGAIAAALPLTEYDQKLLKGMLIKW